MKTPKPIHLVPPALALLYLLAGCSGVANFALGFRGGERMNPNSRNEPDHVEVRVFRLQGDAAAVAFEQAEWSKLWEDPKSVDGLQLEGDIITRLLNPNAEPVTVEIKGVDPKVTHFGVVALFNAMPPKGKDRVLLPRDGAESVEVWVHDSQIQTRKPLP